MTLPFRRTLPLVPFIAAVLVASAHAAPPAAPLGCAQAGNTNIEFSAEASRNVVNDLFRASVGSEASGSAPGDVARQVNAQIGEALKTARNFPAVKAQSNGTSTSPIYGKNGRIEGWRMRSEIALETADSTALSELLGRLQANLAVSALSMQPAAETRRKVENEVTVDAIAAFKARAAVIADAMGKKYRIKQMSVHTSGRSPQPLYRAAAKSMAMEAAPMPVEGGESTISATVNGQIELYE